MDLREFRATPDEGLFEKIERRVRLRRRMRIGAAALAVAAVAVAIPFSVDLGGRRAEVGPHASGITEVGQVIATQTSEGEAQSPHSGTRHQEVGVQGSTLQPATAKGMTSDYIKTDLNPQASDFNRSYLRAQTPDLMQPQPALPPATVRHKEPLLEDLILENDGITSSGDTSAAAKDGGAAPVTPHYDNVLWAPNIIAPFAEEEENRVFKVKSTSEVSDFHMAVFNRGGRQVFSSNDINQGWDARRDGALVPQGTYVWIARFRDSSGTVRQEKGTVTIVR